MNLSHVITQIINKQNISHDVMQEVMQEIMLGNVEHVQLAAFLASLATKGETAEELLAGAQIMNTFAEKVHTSDNSRLVDPVGTGGTNSRVFNVSTASAIVASCLGVTIAKHGGRAASSKSGSADLLERAGVNINLTPKELSECIDRFGFGFMFAPNLHASMKHVAPVRKALGIRTIFNLLGPLTNPSGAQRQVLGVFDKKWLNPIAEVSKKLGKKSIWVVHSHDGLDEISIADKTDVVTLSDSFTIDPVDYGIKHDSLDSIRVNSVEESLSLITNAFKGLKGPSYDMITLNTAAILVVAGIEETFNSAIEKTRHLLDSGQAQEKLHEYAVFTNNLVQKG